MEPTVNGVVTGRNRSYGPQQYIVGPRWGWQNAPSQLASEKLERRDGRQRCFCG